MFTSKSLVHVFCFLKSNAQSFNFVFEELHVAWRGLTGVVGVDVILTTIWLHHKADERMVLNW